MLVSVYVQVMNVRYLQERYVTASFRAYFSIFTSVFIKFYKDALKDTLKVN